MNDLAPSPPDPARTARRLRRLRIVLPVSIFLFVVAHQAWSVVVIDALPSPARFAAGVLVYGLIGPFVTYWTLDWASRAFERQREAEERVRRHERDLASISAGSADAILALDTNGFITRWNRGAGEIFGYTAEEIVGKHIGALMPEALQASGSLAPLRDRVRERGFVRGFQARCRHADGRVVPVDLTQTVLRDEAGNEAGASMILRDMTTRIEAERSILTLNRELEARVEERTAQLRTASLALIAKNEALEDANAELERLDTLKDEFIALVSHELRAPLTNINASTELLLAAERAGGEDREDSFASPIAAGVPGAAGAGLGRAARGAGGSAAPLAGTRTGVRDKLEIIGQEAQRLTRLVQGVLDVSRIQAGRFELRPAPTDPGDLCRRALAALGPDGARVRVDVAADTPDALADFDRAVEVLVNLLENAVKYSPAGSRIELTVAPDPGLRHVLFRVADHGVGVPREELDRIFDRFHRVERGDARETYGHGLGLYIARGIVEAHGGRIEAQSTEGEGSTFAFWLPAAIEGEPA